MKNSYKQTLFKNCNLYKNHNQSFSLSQYIKSTKKRSFFLFDNLLGTSRIAKSHQFSRGFFSSLKVENLGLRSQFLTRRDKAFAFLSLNLCCQFFPLAKLFCLVENSNSFWNRDLSVFWVIIISLLIKKKVSIQWRNRKTLFKKNEEKKNPFY